MGEVGGMRVGVLLGVALFALLAADAASSDLGDGANAVLSPPDDHDDLGSALVIGRRGKSSATIRRTGGGMFGAGGPFMTTVGNFHMSAFLGNFEEAMLGETGQQTTRSACTDKKPRTKPCSWFKAHAKYCGLAKSARRRYMALDASINCKASCGLCKVGGANVNKKPTRAAATNVNKKPARAAARGVDFSDGAWSWVDTYNQLKGGSPKRRGWVCQTNGMRWVPPPTGKEARFYDCVLLKKEFWTRKKCCYADTSCRELEAPKHCLVKDGKDCADATVCVVGSWKQAYHATRRWKEAKHVKQDEPGKLYSVIAHNSDKKGQLYFSDVCKSSNFGRMHIYAWIVKMDLRKVMACQRETAGAQRCAVRKYGRIVDIIPNSLASGTGRRRTPSRSASWPMEVLRRFGKKLDSNNKHAWDMFAHFNSTKPGHFHSKEEFGKAIFADE